MWWVRTNPSGVNINQRSRSLRSSLFITLLVTLAELFIVQRIKMLISRNISGEVEVEVLSCLIVFYFIFWQQALKLWHAGTTNDLLLILLNNGFLVQIISVNLLKSIWTLQRTVLLAVSVQKHSHYSSPSCNEILATSEKGYKCIWTESNKKKMVISLTNLWHFAKPAGNKALTYFSSGSAVTWLTLELCFALMTLHAKWLIGNFHKWHISTCN